MSIYVKICGLTDEDAVAAVADAGADAAGFVFAASPRRVSPDTAAKLAEGLPEDLVRVAVMRHPEPALVTRVCEALCPEFVQSDAEDFHRIELSGTSRPLPVYRAGRPIPERLPALLLFEGPVSGSGEVADWAQARELATRTRVILAGGLTPDNVEAAIRTVRPYGVDVSSGVESEPGRKDPALIQRFVAAVRGAEHGLDSIGDTR
jgi:phosphoribosylanthranilate isomerase